MTNSQPLSPRGAALAASLTKLYATSRTWQVLFEVVGQEYDTIVALTADIIDQMYVRRATWALDRWEQQYGLQVNPSLTVQQRQDRIVARIRGTGTITNRVIMSVANSYVAGGVEVVEDYAASLIVIRFISQYGVPPNIGDLQAAIETIIPAHLVLQWEFRFLLVYELANMNLTVAQVAALAMTVDQLANWRPPS